LTAAFLAGAFLATAFFGAAFFAAAFLAVAFFFAGAFLDAGSAFAAAAGLALFEEEAEVFRFSAPLRIAGGVAPFVFGPTWVEAAIRKSPRSCFTSRVIPSKK
jgi:hypothetical protein